MQLKNYKFYNNFTPLEVCKNAFVKIEVYMKKHMIKKDDKEKTFFTHLALELVEDSLDSLRRDNIHLLTAYFEYLQRLCEYLAITFDAPKFIGINSEAFSVLQHIHKRLLILTKNCNKE